MVDVDDVVVMATDRQPMYTTVSWWRVVDASSRTRHHCRLHVLATLVVSQVR